MSSAVITARVPAETLALIDKVVRQRGRSRSWFIAEAVKQAATAQAKFDALVQEGVDDIEAGRIVPHDEVMAHFETLIAKYEKQCRD